MKPLFPLIPIMILAASEALYAGTISPDEAKKHAGEVMTVTGRVVEFRTFSDEAFLDMGGRHPKETFTVYCSPGIKISRKTLSSFEGKTISVTGKVDLFQGRPEINLISLHQISLL